MLSAADAERGGGRTSAWRIFGLFVVVGFIVSMNSERAYWFYSPSWFGSRFGETAGVAVFYGFAVAGALWALGKIPFRGIHQLVLAGAVFAWTVEGVIVYVLHEGGLFDPFFPAMFAGWHGVLSFVGFFYLVRRWLLERRLRRLAFVASGYGVVWGLWAIASWLPDSDQALEAGALGLPVRSSPESFVALAALLVLAVAGGHLVLDRIWPATWRPGRRSGVVILGLTGLYAAASFFFIPWAPLRWAALIAIPVAGLLWTTRGDAGPNLYETLSGSISGRDLWVLVPAAAVSSAIYAIGWIVDPSDATLEVIQLSHVLTQVATGGAAMVWALRRSRRQQHVATTVLRSP